MSMETIAPFVWEREDMGILLRPWKQEEVVQAAALGWFDHAPVELQEGRLFLRGKGEPRLWTSAEYDCAANLGWFAGEQVELLRGEVYHKVSQNPPHVMVIYIASKRLEAAFGADFVVCQQATLPLLEGSTPDPDIRVATGPWQKYLTRHPRREEIVLLVEVSDTTLHTDLTTKMALYAEAGILDYWALDINSRALIIHRDPAPLPDSSGGFEYREVTTYTESESIAPLAKPEALIRVADLLLPASASEPATEKGE